MIAVGSTVLTDGLACFRGIADAGSGHTVIVTGSGRRAARHPAFRWVNTILSNIKGSIVGTYRAVRRKHIVRTLAEFEWRFNHRTNLAAMISILGNAAVNTSPVPTTISCASHLNLVSLLPGAVQLHVVARSLACGPGG